MKSRRRIWMYLVAAGLFTFCSTKTDKSVEVDDEPGISATGQTDDGWITLFDGKTLDGWKRYNADEIGSLWRVEDGVIVCASSGGEEATEDGGSLITVEQFDNFELEVDFKLSPTGNSGILYHIFEKPEYRRAYETGPEYQLLDDLGFPEELRDNRKTAGNFDMHAAAADKPLKPPGEWNTAKIVYDKGKVEHWLNGARVLQFEQGSQDWQERHSNSKWAGFDGWCEYDKGSIGLQDHGNYTWFRNIRIRKL